MPILKKYRGMPKVAIRRANAEESQRIRTALRQLILKVLQEELLHLGVKTEPLSREENTYEPR